MCSFQSRQPFFGIKNAKKKEKKEKENANTMYKHWALHREAVIGAKIWQYILGTHENLIKNKLCILVHAASKKLT